MKKILSLLLFILFIFTAKSVFSNSNPICTSPGSCSCPPEYPYLDQELITNNCIGEYQISSRESKNLNNIIRNITYLNNFNNEIVFDYLNSDLKNNLATKIQEYYDYNLNVNNYDSYVSTTTIELKSRSERDNFFRDRYVPYIALLKSTNISKEYNTLAESIQDLFVLLNTTDNYIENSGIDISDFSSRIQTATNDLNVYSDKVNLKLGGFNRTISDFDVNDSNSFSEFIDTTSVVYDKETQDLNTEYLAIRDNIIQLATDAITAVEAASVVDSASSVIQASPNVIYNDGVSSSVVTITLNNEMRNPVANKEVGLIVDSDNSTNRLVNITPASDTTDANGVTSFTITSTGLGYISLKVIIVNEDQELLSPNIINVLSIAQKGCLETYGTWADGKCTCPSGESWLYGYTWSDTELRCISNMSIAQKACITFEGSWDGRTCRCPYGYTWDEAALTCKR